MSNFVRLLPMRTNSVFIDRKPSINLQAVGVADFPYPRLQTQYWKTGHASYKERMQAISEQARRELAGMLAIDKAVGVGDDESPKYLYTAYTRNSNNGGNTGA